MKHNLLLLLCTATAMHSMEQNITQLSEWNPYDYAKGAFITEAIAQETMDIVKVNFTDQTVVDVGSGIGNTSNKISKIAEHVHGIDSSNNMVTYSQEKYANQNNLSFECISIETFTTQSKYTIATCFSVLNHIAKKQNALDMISSSLSIGGAFIGNIFTTSNDKPITLAVGLDMIPSFIKIDKFFTQEDVVQKLTPFAIPTDKEVKKIFKKAGLEIVTFEKLIAIYPVKKEGNLKRFCRAISMNHPIMKLIPQANQANVFEKFFAEVLNVVEKNDAGEYLIPVDVTAFKAIKRDHPLSQKQGESI